MKQLIVLISIFALGLSLSANDADLISQINSMGTTWTAKESERFKGFSMDDVKNLLGVVKPLNAKKLQVKRVKKRKDLPENFDLREKYPKCESLREVGDQGPCGSCWALSAAEVMSDRICIYSNQTLQTRISATHLTACCTECGNGCFGGWPELAMQYFVKSGLPTGGLYGDKETCQPYVFPPCEHYETPGEYPPCDKGYSPTPWCEKTCQEGYDKTMEEDIWYGKKAYKISQDENEIMTEIYEHGSVEAYFIVCEDFLTYHKGVYQHVTGKQIENHAIKIIGWGVENGTKYWLCVNSWNDNWGDKGFFKFLRGENHLKIEGDIVAVVPKIPKASSNIIE